MSNLREQLFRLAHDSLGHFGFDKSYASLKDCYYWPRMRAELEGAYVPGCADCQRNKSRTTKAAGPLHPLPVPDARGDSVAIDFVGPLPEDGGLNCLLTMTDRLGSDVRLVPTRIDISAEEFAHLFFDNWYCENGLPLEIICDRDKLFVSNFWRALTKISGVKLGMSTSFHPETDGASERTNKTVNQAIRYHVERDQLGWVCALPRIRFAMMNTVNASLGFTGFQLRLGRSPRLIPPLVPQMIKDVSSELTPADTKRAAALISQIDLDVSEARDNLFAAKAAQAEQANRARGPEIPYKVGDWVMLSTANRRRAYMKDGEKRVAKFLPRNDGPYEIINAYPETSDYTLLMPDNPGIFPKFHASQLRPHAANDPHLFPGRELAKEGPVVMDDGSEEWLIDRIDNERRRGRGYQYHVRYQGWGREHDRWLSGTELSETEALDVWLKLKGRE